MPEDFDRRLGYVLIVVRRASLPQVLEQSGFVFACFNVLLGLDARQIAKFLEAGIGPRPSAQYDRLVGLCILRQYTFQMRADDAIHRPIKGFACLHSAIEQPSPWRLFL
jgi:hypothetical protein